MPLSRVAVGYKVHSGYDTVAPAISGKGIGVTYVLGIGNSSHQEAALEVDADDVIEVLLAHV